MAVTVIDAVSVATENGLWLPLVEVSANAPAEPLVRSHARNVKLALSAFKPSGTKRTRSVSRKSRAELSDTTPTSSQLVPPSIEYCHVPLPLDRLVMAIPSKAKS